MDLKLISNGKKILTEEEDFLLTLFNLMYEYYNDENEIFKDIREDYRIMLYEILEEYSYKIELKSKFKLNDIIN